MADGHHKSYLFFLGCGEEKEPTARTEKYITSIMDEESSDYMDEAGIPMLVSGCNMLITMRPKIWGPDIYMASNTE